MYVTDWGGEQDCIPLVRSTLAKRLEFTEAEISAAVAHLVDTGQARIFTQHPFFGLMYDGREGFQLLSSAVRAEERRMADEDRRRRRAEKKPLSAAGWAYAMRPGGSDVVKIGCSENLAARLRSVQTGHPDKVRIIWQAEGGRALEAHLHEVFEPYRTRGEWFDFSGRDAVVLLSAAVTEWREGSR